MGTIIYSSVSDIPTLQDVPHRPSKPRASLANRACSYDNVDREPRLRLQWPVPEDNGSQIQKYQVQVKEIIKKSALPPSPLSKSPEPMSPTPGSPISPLRGNSRYI
jgi:hypothetical protein